MSLSHKILSKLKKNCFVLIIAYVACVTDGITKNQLNVDYSCNNRVGRLRTEIKNTLSFLI